MRCEVFKGNADGNVVSRAVPADCTVPMFIIANKVNTVAVISVCIVDADGNEILVSQRNFTLADGEAYSGSGLMLLRNESIAIKVTGVVDYYFTLLRAE